MNQQQQKRLEYLREAHPWAVIASFTSSDSACIAASLDRIAKLEAECKCLRQELTKQSHEVEQILGKALGYPSGYPDVSEVDDGSVCVMDHTPETLAMEAARVIVTLKAEVARLNELAEKLVLGTLPIKESIRLQQQIKGPMDWEKFSMLCVELCDCNTCDTCLDRYREE